MLFALDDRWDFTGSTIVTNGYVRLTPDQRSTQGAIWSNVVCNVRYYVVSNVRY